MPLRRVRNHHPAPAMPCPSLDIYARLHARPRSPPSGGDYPLSAVITSEYTPRHLRGAMMAAVFSMQVSTGPIWAQGAPRLFATAAWTGSNHAALGLMLPMLCFPK